jgi:hypothetical protein
MAALVPRRSQPVARAWRQPARVCGLARETKEAHGSQRSSSKPNPVLCVRMPAIGNESDRRPVRSTSARSSSRLAFCNMAFETQHSITACPFDVFMQSRATDSPVSNIFPVPAGTLSDSFAFGPKPANQEICRARGASSGRGRCPRPLDAWHVAHRGRSPAMSRGWRTHRSGATGRGGGRESRSAERSRRGC